MGQTCWHSRDGGANSLLVEGEGQAGCSYRRMGKQVGSRGERQTGCH